MAWNKPSTENQQPKKPNAKAPSAKRGVIAGAVVIALGALCLWIFSGEKARQDPASTKNRGLIKEVAPAATNKVAKTEKELHPGMVKWRGKWYPEYNEKGGRIWLTPAGVRYHSPHVITNAVNPARIPKEARIFDNQADVDIAVLLNTAPGTGFVGCYEYGDRFIKDFLKSLTTPIIVSEQDDENTKMLKRAVIAAKIELKERYDAGEDIGKIMSDTRKQYQELGMYREELRRQVEELQRTSSDRSPQAVKELFDAANRMLAERGAKPLRLPVMLSRKLELMNRNQGDKK